MNELAIMHRPDSEYAYPVDGHTLRLVLRLAHGERLKEAAVLWNNKYEFTARRNFERMRLRCGDGKYDYYVAELTSPDARFAYIFLLTAADGREYYYSEEGVGEEYDFRHGYYTFYQYPFINAADVVRVVPWAKTARFYQIFPDRFRRGDCGKDAGYITQKWEEIPAAGSYAGGDVKGIAEKLDFIAGMGFNALYLTPVFRSPSNHKYNIADYTEVDPMFGTKEDLHQLIMQAHARGMKLVIDTVFNHCDENNEKFLDVRQKGRKSDYYDWFSVRGEFPEKYGGKECNFGIFGNCPYMPKWNTSNPEVREYLTGVALTYLSWGFDGLRLDVADEVSHTFWRELRERVKGSYPEALLIGEVWHENTMYLNGDEFDGVMNYKLQKVYADYFGRGRIGAAEAAGRINRAYMGNRAQTNAMMLNFLDNHDTPRFLRECGEDERLLKRALTALYFSEGMPCVFYGTELPLTGGGDPDCRRTYDWKKPPALYGFLRTLSEMRDKLPDGGMYAEADGDTLVLVRERRGGGERAKAYFGKPGARRNVEETAHGEILFEDEEVRVVKERV